jgi:hypothetical protein
MIYSVKPTYKRPCVKLTVYKWLVCSREILESLYKTGRGNAKVSNYRCEKMFQILSHMADYQVVLVLDADDIANIIHKLKEQYGDAGL